MKYPDTKSSPNNSFKNDLPFPQGLCLASATSSVLFLVNPSPKIDCTASFSKYVSAWFSPPQLLGASAALHWRRLPGSRSRCCVRAFTANLPGKTGFQACSWPAACSDSTACRRSELGILGNDRKQGLPALTHCPIWVFERFDQSQNISV